MDALAVSSAVALLVGGITLTLFRALTSSPAVDQRGYGLKQGPPTPPTPDSEIPVVIIGAGPSGLSMAARCEVAGIGYVVLEAAARAGSSWAGRYSRLHLHTMKRISALPYMDFPSWFPMYVAAKDLASYYRAYSEMLNIRFSTKCTSAVHDPATGRWQVEAVSQFNGEVLRFSPKALIVCSGQESVPRIPAFEGLSDYKGTLIHSSSFKTGEDFRGKKALVIGFGNSGAEIALDLWEHDASEVACFVRSPVHVVPRWITRIGGYLYTLLHALPPHMHDGLLTLAPKLLWGDLRKRGITWKRTSPMGDLVNHHRSFVQDIGTMSLIKRGEIKVFGGDVLRRFVADGVEFAGEQGDGKATAVVHPFDVVVCATGFQHTAHAEYLGAAVTKRALNQFGVVDSGRESEAAPGLFFVGFSDKMGRLAEINLETARIVKVLVDKY